ncbi:MAG: molybdopterin-binding protein [Candidatus Bathyarchaeota archaeon]|nr:molybdopterin-binding protein [Candidatus Bathyarchaeota archaeon]
MAIDMEVICVGNELLIGKIPNTNAHWLAKQATQLGVNVKRVTVVQDLIDEIANSICEAIARKPRFIITTGGLGPTFDDKTLQGIARALNRKLEVNPAALEMVKQRIIEYAKKRQMPTETELTPPRVKMATFPEKTEPIINPIGTAPVAKANVDDTVLFALPGVPSEMEAIFTQTIKPLLKEAVGCNMFCEQSIFVEDIMESRLAPLIDQVMSENEGVYIKSHPMLTEIKPRIEAHLTTIASPEEEPARKIFKAATELCRLIEQNNGKAQFQQ